MATPVPAMAPAPGKFNIKQILTYAAELECTEVDTRHFVHRWVVDHNNHQLAKVPKILEGTGLPCTVPNCMMVSAKKNAQRQCMGVRPITECIIKDKKQFWKKGDFAWRTYEQVYTDMQETARGILQLEGIQQKRMEKKQVVCVLLAETSAEWMVSAQACMASGCILTTVYATLGIEAMLYGIQQTEAEVIFMDWGLYDKVKDEVLSKCTSLRHVIFIGKDFVPETTTGAAAINAFPSAEAALGMTVGAARCSTLDGVIAKGKASTTSNLTDFAPGEEDIAMIMYTSGSTGLPKGVVLTHLNLVSVCASAIAQGTIRPLKEDVLIAYLPLAHIMELLVEVTALSQGSALGYAHPRSLTASSPYIKSTVSGVPDPGFQPDLACLRPTVMVAVPAVLELIATGLKTAMAGGLVGQLISGAVARKLNRPAGCGMLSWLDKPVLNKVKVASGLDKVRLLISGGAPLAVETQALVEAVFSPVVQGYGATETAACATVQECFQVDGRPPDLSAGRVGAILFASELKLQSVHEMGYLVTDSPPRGEILVTGNNVTPHGYFKMPEETAESFITHSDGKTYFHSGDIGVLEADGVLRIVDRKKDLIKLQGGEYVSLGKVEATLKQVPGIGACCVFARPDKSHCVVVVSQPEKGWKSVGGRPDEAALTIAIEATLRGLGLARFEIPTKVGVDDAIWTPETGLVTASMKVQRAQLRKLYNRPGGLLEEMDYSFPQ